MHSSIDDFDEEDHEIKEESKLPPVPKEKIYKCKRDGCKGILEQIGATYRCIDCWKVYFYHEVD
jgi:hypothetical protein